MKLVITAESGWSERVRDDRSGPGNPAAAFILSLHEGGQKAYNPSGVISGVLRDHYA